MTDQTNTDPAGQTPPPFDHGAPHMESPKLRPVRGFPVPAQSPDGKQVNFLGLSDAKQIADKPPVVVAPQARDLLQHFTGENSLENIVEKIGRGLTREHLEPLVAQLDAAGLLEGPTFDAMLTKMHEQFDASTTLPPGSTAAVADAIVQGTMPEGEQATDEQKAEQGPAKLAETMDKWIDQALKDEDNPAFDTLPKAIVAPHIDYPRGWINYAKVWGRLRTTDRPDRVVILGTNHFGMGTGVVGCDKGFATPLGECPVDADVVAGLRQRLGDTLFDNRYDHEREHSIELQIAWLQHCLGQGPDGSYCKVFGALVHDPATNNGDSYDGNGIALDAFVDAMKETLAELPGKTLVVSSADLSHVGPMFGDQQRLVSEEGKPEQLASDVAKGDQEFLGMLTGGKPDDLISAMAWQGNPTRWCSVGNMVAAIRITEPDSVELLNYSGAMDPQGMGLVTHAAMVLR